MFSVKEILGDVRSSVVSMITAGAVLILAPVASAIWKFIRKQPIQWSGFTVLVLIGTALVGIAIWKLNKAKKKKNNELKQPASRDLDVELQLERGLIGVRVTNRKDSEVRVEDLWIASLDATGKKTEAKEIRKHKFKRCDGMPHVMPPRSSFEMTFFYSDGAFQSYAQSHPQRAQTEYWIEVKLEDGTVVPSDHRHVVIPNHSPLGRNRSPAVSKLIDEALRIIREDKVQFTLYALQKAGVGDLDSEEEFSDAREAIIQRNLPDPIKDLSIAEYGATWLALIRFANTKEMALYNPVAVYDCLQTYLSESTATPSAKASSLFKPLEVEALPASPNLANKTQLGWKMTGRPEFDADCIFRIHNRNPTQGIDGVEFRLFSIQPALVSFRGFDPTTDDTKLRRLPFRFTDIDGKTLKGGQAGDVCVLAVTRNFAAEERLKNISIELGGKRTNDTKSKFTPATTDHILTVEVTANGLPRTKSQFHMAFSTKPDEPVFTITKLPL